MKRFWLLFYICVSEFICVVSSLKANCSLVCLSSSGNHHNHFSVTHPFSKLLTLFWVVGLPDLGMQTVFSKERLLAAIRGVNKNTNMIPLFKYSQIICFQQIRKYILQWYCPTLHSTKWTVYHKHHTTSSQSNQTTLLQSAEVILHSGVGISKSV